MPSLFKKSKLPSISSSEDTTTQTRPLMYAPSTTSSFHADTDARNKLSPQATSDPLHVPGVRDGTHGLITSDIFGDIELHKRQKALRAAKQAEENRAARIRNGMPETEVDDEEGVEAGADIERPSTPPQGSRSIPWESYHDLPSDHPVFLYPAEVREKMYAKNIDPVLRAMADRNIRGKVYGKHRGLKGFFQQAKVVMNQEAGMSMGGAY